MAETAAPENEKIGLVNTRRHPHELPEVMERKNNIGRLQPGQHIFRVEIVLKKSIEKMPLCCPGVSKKQADRDF